MKPSGGPVTCEANELRNVNWTPWQRVCACAEDQSTTPLPTTTSPPGNMIHVFIKGGQILKKD